MPRNQSQHAAEFTIYINSQVFGIASGFNWRTTTGAKAIRGIDSSIPFEIAPGAAHISGSISCYRLQDSAGIEGYGISPVEAHITRARYFDLQLVNRVTDTVVLRVPKAMASEQDWQLASGQLLHGSFNFEGLGWANEF